MDLICSQLIDSSCICLSGVTCRKQNNRYLLFANFRFLSDTGQLVLAPRVGHSTMKPRVIFCFDGIRLYLVPAGRLRPCPVGIMFGIKFRFWYFDVDVLQWRGFQRPQWLTRPWQNIRSYRPASMSRGSHVFIVIRRRLIIIFGIWYTMEKNVS